MPTASFGTLFNEQTSPEQTTDSHTLLDLEYTRSIGTTQLSGRASYDRYWGEGIYPFAAVSSDVVPLVGRNDVLGTRWTAETRLTRPLPGRQVLTAGAEFIDNLHQDQRLDYNDPSVEGFIQNRSSTQHALFAQDELKVARWLIVNAGLRYDSYEDFSRVTPRAAVIVMPSPNQSFKYLFGSAFRAPNAYELNTFYFGPENLRPESIDTHEIVWERYTNDWLRTSVSGYWYRADSLITLMVDPSTRLGLTYANEGRVRAKGLELEAQMRLKGGVQGQMSYALQQVTDQDTQAALINSPRHMLKARVSAHGPTNQSSIAVEALAFSSRMTLLGNSLPPFALASVTMVQPIGRSFDISGTVRNLFNAQYAVPGSDQQLQDSIPQNGRTFRIGVRWKFPAK